MTTYQKASELPADAWAKVAEGTWLADVASLERSGLACEWRYFVASNNNGPVAFAAGCFLSYPLAFGLTVRIFSLGSPVNLGSPFAGDPTYFPLLADAARTCAADGGAKFVLARDFTSAQDIPSWHSLSLFTGSQLDLTYPTFDAYLTSLSSAERKRYARFQTYTADHGYTVEQTKNITARELHTLWHALFGRKLDRDQIPLTEAYFEEALHWPHAVFLVLKKNGTPVAFDMALRYGDSLTSLWCGHAELATKDFSPNRYMGFALVQWAITNGIKTIDFGISNESVKKDFGCRQAPLYALVSGTGRTTRTLINLALRLTRSGESSSKPTPTLLTDERPHVVILGAGLSGLTAAAKLTRSGARVTVLEASSDIGGPCGLRALKSKKERHVTGCNLFHEKFFSTLSRELGINLPTVEAPIWVSVDDGVYPPDLWDAFTEYRRRGLGLLPLAKTALRIAATAITWPYWRQKTYAQVVDFVGASSPLVRSLLLQYASLSGLPASAMPAKSLAFLRDELKPPVYPKAGLQSVPQSLARLVEKDSGSHILKDTRAERIVITNGKASGVIANGQLIAADAVISTLTLAQTNSLLPKSQQVAVETKDGHAVAALLLTVASSTPLPLNVHTFSFTDEFDLVSPDNLQPRRPGTTFTATVYFDCPVDATDKDARISDVLARLERQFPGFQASITWQRALWPEDYASTVGFASVSNQIAVNPAALPKTHAWPHASGLFQANWPAPAAVRSSYTAITSGLACAKLILRS